MFKLSDNIQNIKNGLISEQLYHKRHGKTFAKWAKIKNLDARKKEVLKDKTLVWNIASEEGAIADHIEMSAFYSSAIISYGKDKDGFLRLHRHVSFPNARIAPNLTASHLRYDYKDGIRMFLEDSEIKLEKPQNIKIRGYLSIESDFMCGAKVVRTFVPSINYQALIEKIEVTNLSKDNAKFTAKEKRNKKIIRTRKLLEGKIEVNSRLTDSRGDFRSEKAVTVEKLLVPNATVTCYVVHYAVQKGKTINFNAEKELKERLKFVDYIFKSIQLTSNDFIADAFLSHSLLRGAESIYNTKNGYLHSPGGGNFYGALWANDQCEYVNPFFPFLGYDIGTKEAINCYKIYSEYVLRGECAPASVIALAEKPYGVAGDRGDTEMFLYGLSRFLLANGDKALALEMFPAIDKAVDFILNKKSAEGVIFSNSDELEGRFPSGDYNLSTNCLALDGLTHTAYLAKELNLDSSRYEDEAKLLKQAILKYFRSTVEGFDTYIYYKGNTTLRSWICLPSIVGIDEAAATTYEALFSPQMLVNNTLRCTSSNKTVWDRALLYALRGAFITNNPKALEIFKNYATSRLLGAHSPYPYEAYPEGNRAHLAGESILLARVITEGMFGLDPIGFDKLIIKPTVSAKLSGVNYFGNTFEIDSTGELKIKIASKVYPASGKTIFNFTTLSWQD